MAQLQLGGAVRLSMRISIFDSYVLLLLCSPACAGASRIASARLHLRSGIQRERYPILRIVTDCCASAREQSAKSKVQSATAEISRFIVLTSHLAPHTLRLPNHPIRTRHHVLRNRRNAFRFLILRHGSGHALDFRLFGHRITLLARASTLGGIVRLIWLRSLKIDYEL